MSGEGDSERFSRETKQAAGLLTRYGAALATVGLGTAFLYDWAFASATDSRVLTAYVLADHIETAAVAIPTILIVLASLVALNFGNVVAGWYLNRIRQRFRILRALLAWCFVVLLVVALVTLLAPDSWLAWLPIGIGTLWLLVGVVFLLLVFGTEPPNAAPFSPEVGWKRLKEASLVFWLALWIAGTTGVAFAEAHAIKNGINWRGGKLSFDDVVTLPKDRQLSGRIIRIIERGVILYDPTTKQFVLVPKDQVHRASFGTANK